MTYLSLQNDFSSLLTTDFNSTSHINYYFGREGIKLKMSDSLVDTLTNLSWGLFDRYLYMPLRNISSTTVLGVKLYNSLLPTEPLIGSDLSTQSIAQH